jgi:hypothetical protein
VDGQATKRTVEQKSIGKKSELLSGNPEKESRKTANHLLCTHNLNDAVACSVWLAPPPLCVTSKINSTLNDFAGKKEKNQWTAMTTTALTSEAVVSKLKLKQFSV